MAKVACVKLLFAQCQSEVVRNLPLMKCWTTPNTRASDEGGKIKGNLQRVSSLNNFINNSPKSILVLNKTGLAFYAIQLFLPCNSHLWFPSFLISEDFRWSRRFPHLPQLNLLLLHCWPYYNLPVGWGNLPYFSSANLWKPPRSLRSPLQTSELSRRRKIWLWDWTWDSLGVIYFRHQIEFLSPLCVRNRGRNALRGNFYSP